MIKNPKDSGLNIQIETLLEILKLNKTLQEVIDVSERTIDYPWYVAGGGIYHSIWNYYSERPIKENIKDYDVLYFSPRADEKEHKQFEKELEKISGKPKIDLTNVATVHTWFKKEFGREIPPYQSVEEDINSFGISIAAIGLTRLNGKIKVYAPYGLHDIFAMEARCFSDYFTKKENVEKASSWKKRWPNLKIFSE